MKIKEKHTQQIRNTTSATTMRREHTVAKFQLIVSDVYRLLLIFEFIATFFCFGVISFFFPALRLWTHLHFSLAEFGIQSKWQSTAKLINWFSHLHRMPADAKNGSIVQHTHTHKHKIVFGRLYKCAGVIST